MKNQAVKSKAFVEYLHRIYADETNIERGEKLANAFLCDFVVYTPQKLQLIGSFALAGNFYAAYHSLPDLKILNAFSDELHRYWLLLRAYSGALTRLRENYSVTGAKNLYVYYFGKYGQRRVHRIDHWFEKQRWEFLDELAAIFTESDLDHFLAKYRNKFLKIQGAYLFALNKLISEIGHHTNRQSLKNPV